MNSITTVALHSLCRSIRYSVYDMVHGISELSLCDCGMDHGFIVLLCYFSCCLFTISLYFHYIDFVLTVIIINTLLWLTSAYMADVGSCFSGKK
jgi:hypothetical protein